SHDRELLDRVDQIAELRGGEVRWYGGNFTDYEETLAVEQEAAERTVRAAEAGVRRQKRELVETRTKLDRRGGGGGEKEASRGGGAEDRGGNPQAAGPDLRREAARHPARPPRRGQQAAGRRRGSAARRRRDPRRPAGDVGARRARRAHAVRAGGPLRRPRRADRPRAGADRADRPERGGQAHLAAHDHRRDRTGLRRGQAGPPGPVPCA